MNYNPSYWQGKEPKSSKELKEQIKNALLALQQWKDAADMVNIEDAVMIDAQILWLKELFELADVKLKH